MRTIGTLLILAACSVCPKESAGDTVDIREWLVPWEVSAEAAAYVDVNGRVWFAGADDDYIGNFSPDSATFSRYDLPGRTRPVALAVDANGHIVYASNNRRHIGILDPATARIEEIAMPDRAAKALRAMIFDDSGDIWFTADEGNFVGRLLVASRRIDLVRVPTRKSRPYGIAVGPANEPWVAASGRNLLLRIDPADMSIREVETPNANSRPHRIAVTTDGRIWYTDPELGQLGSFDPQSGVFHEWAMPGGENSRPFALAADRNDHLWIVETGPAPNRLVGFAADAGAFLTETDIPSGAGSVQDLHYYEPAGELWFTTDTNYLGRAKVH